MAMDDLARFVSRKRGSTGIRAAAKEIGISPATLSKVERGHVPDLGTLRKICNWMDEDPARFVGNSVRSATHKDIALQIAFKKKTAVSQKTAKSLAKLIQLASQQFASKIESEGH